VLAYIYIKFIAEAKKKHGRRRKLDVQDTVPPVRSCKSPGENGKQSPRRGALRKRRARPTAAAMARGSSKEVSLYGIQVIVKRP